ncbi:recombinase family protein [Paenibacillus taichungensis]
MRKIKVVAYCRVSTNSKEQESSYENQHLFFRERASTMEDEELVRIYADKGLTATSIKRRVEFKQMLYDAGINEYRGRDEFTYEIDHTRKPLFDKIYVRNTSRFTRDASIISILRALLKNKVYVHFLDIDLIYDDVSKEFMLNLFINFSQQESVDRSKKVKDGNAVTASKGTIRIGGKGMYGYEYDPETKAAILVPEEAKIIQKIYELYLKGYGIRRIRNYLEANNIRPKKKGKTFAISTIKRILTNEKYYGCNVRNKYDTGAVLTKHYPKLKDSEDWIYHEGAIPAIITKEDFLQAEKIRLSNVHSLHQKGTYSGISEYAGAIKCSKCNASYTRNIDKGRVFFNCGTKKQRGSKVCDGINVNESLLTEALDDILNNDIESKFNEYKNMIINILEKTVKQKMTQQINKDNEDEVRKLKTELKTVLDKKNKLIDLYLEDRLDKNMLELKSEELSKKQVELDVEIQNLSKTNVQIYNEISEFDLIVSKIKNTTIEKITTKEELLKLILIIPERDKNNPKHPKLHIQFKFDTKIKELASKYVNLEGIKPISIHT